MDINRRVYDNTKVLAVMNNMKLGDVEREIGVQVEYLSRMPGLSIERAAKLAQMFGITVDDLIYTDYQDVHVCGLCQYDGAYKGVSGDWCGERPGFDSDDCFCMNNEIRRMCGRKLMPEQD